jgi:hypothetical protein
VKTVLKELMDLFNGYLHQWDVVQLTLKSELESILFQKNIRSIYRDKEGEFEGEILGIQDDGRLIIEVGKEQRVYAMKEVQFC